jgi:hypothetical protein
MADPPSYEFVVFSELVDGHVQTKLAACPNCGIIHKVVDLCTSEILNRDDSRTLTSIDDIKSSLSAPLIAILEKHDVDVSVWEHARWIVENNSWGSFVILEQEKVKGGKNVKLMTLLGTTLFRIETRFVEAEVL